MDIKDLRTEDFWRALILYGRNQSTYKIALGFSLIRFSQQGKTHVTMTELAEDFFDMYLERLKNGKPQLFVKNRRTVMEDIVDQYNLGKIDRTLAIEQVEKKAFHDVIQRFHNLYDMESTVKFYEYTSDSLVLTDHLFELVTTSNLHIIRDELDSRWSLLEAAFEIRRNDSKLVNDIRKFYLQNGYERTDITKHRPILNAYQNHVCFYCGEPMSDDDIHVDHVIPRQFLHHDEIWNLVLAHGFCNQLKSDLLPPIEYIKKLYYRNEYFIESNHPIKEKLIEQLGKTPKQREGSIMRVYQDAKIVLGSVWEGIKGYNFFSDPIFRTLVNSLNRIK